MSYTVLIADDEKEIRELLSLYLEKDGYVIRQAENGKEAFDIISSHYIDLAMIDIMMPQLNGYQLMKKIRETSKIPIMIISAKMDDNDKILGLGLGADDYITKPFNPLEVTARVNANLRRFYNFNHTAVSKVIQVRNLSLDMEQCVLYKDDKQIQLTSTEFKIIKLFMESPGRVFTKQQIFEIGWGENHIVDDNTIMVCISKMRAKIEDENTVYIKTIRGLGYRLEK